MDGRFPEKLFYRIGDVAAITGIKPHVLRYWESEFSGLHPRKNRAGRMNSGTRSLGRANGWHARTGGSRGNPHRPEPRVTSRKRCRYAAANYKRC